MDKPTPKPKPEVIKQIKADKASQVGQIITKDEVSPS